MIMTGFTEYIDVTKKYSTFWTVKYQAQNVHIKITMILVRLPLVQILYILILLFQHFSILVWVRNILVLSKYK